MPLLLSMPHAETQPTMPVSLPAHLRMYVPTCLHTCAPPSSPEQSLYQTCSLPAHTCALCLPTTSPAHQPPPVEPPSPPFGHPHIGVEHRLPGGGTTAARRGGRVLLPRLHGRAGDACAPQARARQVSGMVSIGGWQGGSRGAVDREEAGVVCRVLIGKKASTLQGASPIRWGG